MIEIASLSYVSAVGELGKWMITSEKCSAGNEKTIAALRELPASGRPEGAFRNMGKTTQTDTFNCAKRGVVPRRTPARIPPGKVRGVSVKNLCTPVGNGIGHTALVSLFLAAFPRSDALYHGGKKILGLQKIYCLVRVRFFMGWLV